MLSRSMEQRRHWLDVIIWRFARIPLQGIAPKEALQQWILIFAGTFKDQIAFHNGLEIDASKFYLVVVWHFRARGELLYFPCIYMHAHGSLFSASRDRHMLNMTSPSYRARVCTQSQQLAACGEIKCCRLRPIQVVHNVVHLFLRVHCSSCLGAH